jgi:aldehyde:ferredoxin oxidoreductase
MYYGFHNKIIKVDLSNRSVEYEEKGDDFYRKYLGGGGIGGYYLSNNVPPGTDAFSEANMLVFSTGVATGAPLPGFSRHSATSISPLTGGICDSEAGGFWGAELKFAGYDAIVIQGASNKPVYLYIDQDGVRIEEADKIWGGFLKEARAYIAEKHEAKRLRILGIGPGGERKVRFACITGDLRDAHGRGGLGAVMGAKNLKAVAVSSKERGISMKDPARVKEIAKDFAMNFAEFDHNRLLSSLGTLGIMIPQNNTGQQPTYNWQSGVFKDAADLSAERVRETIFHSMVGCYACPVRCKCLVQSNDKMSIDPDYTKPEYESVSSLGTYAGIKDLPTVCKAIELCNKYTLDTVSTGAVIAFAMECFEKGLISTADTGGIDLSFGNQDALIPLVKMIAHREGIGNLLAEGVKRAAEKIGKGSENWAVHCKGMEFPAHEPRIKKGLALTYGLAPIGADHMAAEQDPVVAPGAPLIHFQRLATLDWRGSLETDDLGDKKVRFNYLTQLLYSGYNCLDVCMFCMPPRRAFSFDDLISAVRAVTGWEYSLWELMKAGERRVNILRYFNSLSGFTPEDDMLPPRMFEALKNGISEGKKIDSEEYKRAVALFYSISGWDETGVPTNGKLLELDLQWLKERW